MRVTKESINFCFKNIKLTLSKFTGVQRILYPCYSNGKNRLTDLRTIWYSLIPFLKHLFLWYKNLWRLSTNNQFQLTTYPAYSLSNVRSASNRCKMADLFSRIDKLISGTGGVTACTGGGGRGRSHLARRDKIRSPPEIKVTYGTYGHTSSTGYETSC